MKRFLFLFMFLVLVLVSSCTKSKNAYSIEPEQNVDIVKPDIPVVIEDNTFFFRNNISEVTYEGTFLFNDIIEKNVILHINEVANQPYGKWYELVIESIEKVPNDRLNLGYFYMEQDKIYRLYPTEENLNKIKTSKEIPGDAAIVCQDKALKDSLADDELGWHQYIEVEGDKRTYHSYNNQAESGFYETFIWEKNKGLILYRSGYGAERDAIELQLIND